MGPLLLTPRLCLRPVYWYEYKVDTVSQSRFKQIAVIAVIAV